MPAPSKTQEEANMTTKVFEIYIKATPQAVWDAITTPEWTAKYGYRAPVTYELRAGGKYRVTATAEMRALGLAETIIDGEVIESIPPRKLVHTYRFLFTPADEAEGYTRVTWEIEPAKPGFTRLTVMHELDGAPRMSASVSRKYSEDGGGGWYWILSDLKSLLETGRTMEA